MFISTYQLFTNPSMCLLFLSLLSCKPCGILCTSSSTGKQIQLETPKWPRQFRGSQSGQKCVNDM